MPKTVQIQGVGSVQFPDAMTDDQIVTAIEKDILHQSSVKQPASPEHKPETFLSKLGRWMSAGAEAQVVGQADILQAIEQGREQPLFNVPVSPKVFSPVASPEVAEGLARGTSRVLSSLTAPGTAVTGAGLAALTAIQPQIGILAAASLGAATTGQAAGTMRAMAEAGDVTGVAEQVPPLIAGEIMTAAPFGIRTVRPIEPQNAVIVPEIGPKPLALPAPSAERGPFAMPESPLAPRTEGYRIKVPEFKERSWSSPEPDPAAVQALKDLSQRSLERERETGEPYKPETVSTDLRQLQKRMRKNTVSTWESWADKTIRDKLGGTSANPFLDPEFMSAAAVKGAVLIKRGVKEFKEWSKPMVDQFGIGILTHLEELFDQSKAMAGEVAKDVPLAQTETGQALAEVVPSIKQGEEVIDLKSSDEFPSFQPWEKNEKIATQPQNFGQLPGLGWIFDPRAVANEPIQRAMITGQFEKRVGDALALVEIEKIRGEINDAFQLEGSRILNIKPTRADQSTFIADAFEELQRDPNAFELSPEQRIAFAKAEHVREKIGDLLEREGLPRKPTGEIQDENGQELFDFAKGVEEEAQSYFPRPALSKIGVLKPSLASTGGVLKRSKEFFEKSRAFKSEADGTEAGITYEPDIEGRLFMYARSAYRSIAEKRLGKALKKFGQERGSPERRAAIHARLGHLVAEGKMTPAELESWVHKPFWEEQMIDARVLRNTIFPDKVAEAIERYRPREILDIFNKADRVNNLFKSTTLGFDVGWLTLQGAALFKNPIVYSRVAARSLEAVFDHRVLKKILDSPDNLQAMRELADLGVPLGTLPDFQRGLAAGQILPSIPVVGKAAESLARGMQVFLDMGTMEMWKAFREVTPKDQWAAVAEQIGNAFFRGRVEEIGVLPERAFLERLLFQSPAYYRAAVNLVAGFGRSSVSGAVARRAVGSVLAAGTFLFGAMALMNGMSWGEIKKRLNPQASNFMMVPAEFKNGEKIEVGTGGPVRSIIRLFGEITEAASDRPEDLIDPAKGDRNPILRWLRGKLAPLPSIIWDVIKNKNFLGDEVSIWQLFQERWPLSLQTEGIFEGAINFVGLQAWPEGIRSMLATKREALARERYKKAYGNLSIQDQVRIAAELASDPELNAPRTEAEQRRIISIATELDLQRRKRLSGGLPKEIRNKMSDLMLHVTGYDSAFQFGDVRLILTREQQSRYEKLIIDDYKRTLPVILDNPSFELMAPDKRQEVLNRVMQAAKGRARAQLFREQGEIK